MLKGKAVIELTDVNTGQKEIYEETNLVTEAVANVLNTNIDGMLYNNTSFNNSNGDNWLLPIKKNIMGGILLYQNGLDERADNIYAPLDNPLIGYASDDANNTLDVKRGSRNLTESKEVDGGYRFVWDFATSQANGTISAICLTNTLAGRGTESAGNYLVNIGSWSTGRIETPPAYIYRDNKRTFIEEGYRLEMTTRYNSTEAVLRKYKDDYLHASIVDRPLMRVVREAEEETVIDVGHYPLYNYYTGGSRDGTEGPSSSSTDVKNYLYHGADGKWYGIIRRDNQRYDYTSGSTEYYTHVSYEWYLVTINGSSATTSKIVVPSGLNDFFGFGMSGKWLMCSTNNNYNVYRLDTTNVANIEQVPNFTYTSSSAYTFIIDDDIVINGWYFLNGEPKQRIREVADASYIAWGRTQMARYKTYAIREWFYNYSYYEMRKELYLYTPYLATINNLGSPVIKTADKTMKITYTITESSS